jgi:hypothetical protein
MQFKSSAVRHSERFTTPMGLPDAINRSFLDRCDSRGAVKMDESLPSEAIRVAAQDG